MQKDIQQEVTAQIIELMETEGTNWTKPFEALAGIPQNASTGNEYNGINVLLLALQGQTYWASYKQWQAMGAQVRKGERGTRITCPIIIRDKEDDSIKGKFFKAATVFSSAQVDGWEAPSVNIPKSQINVSQIVEEWIANTGAKITFNDAGSCFYRPSDDFISMSRPESFHDTDTSTATECYYSTLLHELTHWSGAAHRLDRTKGKKFGDSAYAFEELVAEIGAAMQCVILGVSSTPRPDHAKYLNHWIKVLKDDKRFIFDAASEAQKAVNFISELQSIREAA